MRPAPRWEVGSAYPLGLPDGGGRAGLPDPLRLYGSGRQALAALLEFGRREYGWTAVHVPEYYCPEVVDDIAGLLPVRRYDVGPADHAAPPDVGRATRPLTAPPDAGRTSAAAHRAPPPAGPTEAVVLVSYFGTAPAGPAGPSGAWCAADPPPSWAPGQTPGAPALIIDATHDPLAPWLSRTEADYVFASLRKTLPLPDGGALWSTAGRELPAAAAPTDRHRLAAGTMLSAMCLKAAYLGGAALDKEPYLALYADGEQRLRGRTVSAISDFSAGLLRALPAEELRERRIGNATVLAAGLRALDDLTVRAHALGVVVECDSYHHREALRRELIARAVYPAVLWTLRPHEAAPRHLDFSRRMLFLHSDARWTERDMRRVATLVRQAHERARLPGAVSCGPPPPPRRTITEHGPGGGLAPEGAPC